MGRRLAALGISANQVTLSGMVLGLAAAVCIWQGYDLPALGLVIISRLLDGLDGAIARASQGSDLGGYLDILCDFVFYIAVPVAFGFRDPANLPAALVLTGSFALTGVSFLAFATIAGQKGMATSAHGKKSFFYSTGLAEGAETILAFVLMCLWPDHFNAIAWAYAGLCLLTVVQRSVMAVDSFKSTTPEEPLCA
jgi:phosphatidylglycerophosphate synthase